MAALFKRFALAAFVCLLAGCTSPARPSRLLPTSAEGVVVLPLGTSPAEVGGNPPLWALRFAPFSGPRLSSVRFVALRRIPSDNGGSIEGELWEVVFTTRGPWSAPPSFGSIVEWQLADRDQSRAFAASRKELFELQCRDAPEIAQCILLRRAGDPTRFMALELSGVNPNNKLAPPEDSPAVRAFLAANPLTRWGAREVHPPHRGYILQPL